MTGSIRAAGYRDALAGFGWPALWELFDGDAEHLNIAHECIDRHPADRVAARIAFADGRREEYTFGELGRATSQFAHLLEEMGIGAGDRVAVMMQPSVGFYTALFGAIKRGAVGVPLYTLFGPDAVRDRLEDCGASLVIADPDVLPALGGLDVLAMEFETDVLPQLASRPESYVPDTRGTDLAILQYTSGTSRQLPEAVEHDHRAIVTLARAGIFGLGLADGDRYFCPSSPAWGHGLWHGTIAPWSLGVALGSYSGRFDVGPLVDALVAFGITNLAAASTIYRMVLRSGRASELSGLEKASYTGEELDPASQQALLEAASVSVRGMYGTTETGVILGNYPGFPDFEARIGALGKPLPGCEVGIIDTEGGELGPDAPGEIAVRRRGKWFRSKDLGRVDADGYFWYIGRADDVIIAAGWTISPVEVERTLLRHPAVAEAAVVGVPDDVRGQIVKAVLVAERSDPELVAELQTLVREQLSAHEYPRAIEFVDALPKTPNGKVNRRALRQQHVAA